MANADIPNTRADCEALDRLDPLAGQRAAFLPPDGVIYLDGHSLGPATHAALKRIEHTAQKEWANGLIRSWNDAGWIDLPRTVGAKLARLIGAQPGEVIVTDSVSVNLFKLAAAALPHATRLAIIVEDSEFPTDQYIAEGLASSGVADFIRAGEDQGANTLAQLGGGVLIKSVVNYRTARVSDIKALEEQATANGGLIVWDLSHATGVIDLDLNASGAKLATGCTYKFLNGGPGAPAFIYAHASLASQLQSPITGWFGHADPFAFTSAYTPREGVSRFATGTPGVLSLSALDAALDAFAGVDTAMLARKARQLGDLVTARVTQLGLETISPSDGAMRGGHVSVRHPDGYAIVQALIARGIISDFRAPDAMRFGVSPLYLRFTDVWDAMDQLQDVLATRAFDHPDFHRRSTVT
ncbi:MAG: aminotransferase class V-fold PLP-dependent enzyme [Hyphomonadaceae bacterium]|nr:aminotransferase class V-fold PLP-dependent enzyme [Hyphomonadaceae bacterium]